MKQEEEEEGFRSEGQKALVFNLWEISALESFALVSFAQVSFALVSSSLVSYTSYRGTNNNLLKLILL